MAGTVWLDRLRADPLPWLLEPSTPAVRAATLQRIIGLPGDDPHVIKARSAGDGGRSDPGDPRCPGTRWLVGEAGTGVLPQVPEHRLEPDLPRATRCRSGASGCPGGRRVRPPHLPHRSWRIRVLGIASGEGSPALFRAPLPQRQPAAVNDRFRVPRRPTRPGSHRLGGQGHHRRRHGALVCLANQWTRLRMRTQRR